MKRVFFLLLTLLMTSAVSAQTTNDSIKTILMNRTFSVGGKALMCLRSANAAKRDLKPLEWTLENHPIGEKNFITLHVKNAKTGLTEASQTWSDGERVVMTIDNKGNKKYQVYDDTFRHLLMADLGKDVYVLFLYSQLLTEEDNINFEK